MGFEDWSGIWRPLVPRLQVLRGRKALSREEQPANTQSCVSWFSTLVLSLKWKESVCVWLFPAHCSDLSEREVDIGKEEVFIGNADLQIPSCVCVCVFTQLEIKCLEKTKHYT